MEEYQLKKNLKISMFGINCKHHKTSSYLKSVMHNLFSSDKVDYSIPQNG